MLKRTYGSSKTTRSFQGVLRETCPNHLVNDKEKQVAARVMMEKTLRSRGFNPDALPIQHLDINHPTVRAVAYEIARIGEELLAKAGSKA